MRTAESIAQQQETASVKKPTLKPKKPMHPNSLKNLRPPWKPGECPVGAGRPKNDLAALFARAVLEKSLDVAFHGFVAQLAKGNAYAFKELAERGYGKLPQHVNVTNTESIAGLISEGRKRVAARKAQRIQ